MTINVQVVPEKSLKTLPLWFLFRTGEAFHREETNQVEVLEGESVFSQKLFFSTFSTKRKLIDDSFEHSGSHLCLKTVHLALH